MYLLDSFLHGLWPIPLIFIALAGWFFFQTGRTHHQGTQIKVIDKTTTVGYVWKDAPPSQHIPITSIPTFWGALLMVALTIVSVYGFSHWWQ